MVSVAGTRRQHQSGAIFASPGEICGLVPALLLATLLAACAQAPVEPAMTPVWEARKDTLMQLQTWDLQGRIAVRTPADSGSGSLYWTQQDDAYALRVVAPFSGGMYELTGASGAVSLLTPDKTLLQATDAETLLQQAAGWHLPVSELVYWIRGVPAPALAVEQLLLDAENRITTLGQGGWSIRYKSYTGVRGISLPARLDLENERARVRLSIREWKLP